MALTVETGAIVTGANSYVSRAEYIAAAALVGVTIADTDAADAQLVKAAQFIDAHESDLIGYKVERDQPMAYPRHSLVINRWSWSSTEIPTEVTDCQIALALEINAGIDIYNPAPVRTRKREDIDGAVSVEYFGRDSDVTLGRNMRAMTLLHALLRRGGGFGIPLVRR